MGLGFHITPGRNLLLGQGPRLANNPKALQGKDLGAMLNFVNMA